MGSRTPRQIASGSPIGPWTFQAMLAPLNPLRRCGIPYPLMFTTKSIWSAFSARLPRGQSELVGDGVQPESPAFPELPGELPSLGSMILSRARAGKPGTYDRHPAR